MIGADYEGYNRLYRVSVGIIGTAAADTNYGKFLSEIKLKLRRKKLKNVIICGRELKKSWENFSVK